MKAYYGSRLSEHMTVTPEGYLICLDVPIARTGLQEYLPSELGEPGTDPIQVRRRAQDVFEPSALASFEGKPVTLDHPPAGIDIQNASAYIRGHAQNVRRGAGPDRDLIISDLFITDPELKRLILKEGLREISCGYECEYARGADGALLQQSIRGNHIAVVLNGRAGERVAIKDKNHTQERGKTMRKKDKNTTLMSRMFAGWARDAEPEEIAEAVDQLVEQAAAEDDEAMRTDNEAPVQDEAETLQRLLLAVEALTQKVDALERGVHFDENPIDELMDELSAAQPGLDAELAVAVPSDELPGAMYQLEEFDEEAQILTPDEGLATMSDDEHALLLSALRALKPIIAKLPEAERREAADAAVKQIRRAMGKSPRARVNNYTRIQKKRARAADARRADDFSIGRDIMKKRNPHYRP